MNAPLPAPPAQTPDQSVLLHGCELVRYLIRTETAALLTAADLERADHAIGFLLARQARPNEEISPRYFETLQSIRRLITSSVAGRKLEAAELEQREQQQPPAPPAGGPRPGRGGEHQPAGPLPKTQPPAPGHARPAPPPPPAPRFAPPRRPAPVGMPAKQSSFPDDF